MPSVDLACDPEHPAFAGHFPGRPLVPGVLLLDWAQHAVESATGLVLEGVAVAKFLSPALPGDALTVVYEVDAQAVRFEVRFEVRCGARAVASGRFLVANPSVP